MLTRSSTVGRRVDAEGGRVAVLASIVADAPLEEIVGRTLELLESEEPSLQAAVTVPHEGRLHVLDGGRLTAAWRAVIDGREVREAPGACAAAIRRRSRVVVEAVASDQVYAGLPDDVRTTGPRAVFALPMLAADGTPRGTLACALDEQRGPTLAELRAAERAATLVNLALEREATTERVHQSDRLASDMAAEQAAQHRVAVAISAAEQPSRAFGLVVEELGRLVDADSCVAGWFDDDGAVTTVGSWSRRPGADIPDLDDASLGALREGRGVVGSRRAGGQRRVAAPVVVGGNVWGFLVAARRRTRPFAPEEAVRVIRFAELVALAVGNAEVRAHARRVTADQTALRRLATGVAAGLEPADVVALVVEEVLHLFDADGGTVLRVLPDGDLLALSGDVGEEGDGAGRLHRQPHEITTAVLASGRAERRGDVPSAGLPHQLAAPIMLDGRIWGVVVVSRDEPAFRADDEDRLSQFAHLTSLALANAQSRRRADAVREQQAALRGVATTVAAAVSLDEVFALVAREVRSLHGADVGVVWRFEDADHVTVVGADAQPEIHGPATGETVRVAPDDPTRELSRCDPLPRPAGAPNRELRTPIVVGGRVWGAIGVQSSAAPLEGAAQESLESFAELVGLAIANAEARERLANQAFTDPLTGLANHRTFQERLLVEVERAHRHGRGLCLALIDVDSFKQINDALGHQVGDQVLVALARQIVPVLRASDLFARVGGDELALLMPEASPDDALAVAERVRSLAATAGRIVGVPLSVSIGVADLEQAADAEQLVRFADGALYWVKEHGRNRVCRYTPEDVAELSVRQRAEALAHAHAVVGIRALARAVDAKDPSTQRHSERVAAVARMLAEELGWDAEDLVHLHEAGLIHDVGKIGVPDAILLRPGPLGPVEFEQVKVHAALGAQIVGEILAPEQVAWVRGHHERLDGTGYPDGLRASEIADGARLLALADAWDVMTSERPYRPGMPVEAAVEECRRHSGTQFWDEAVAALERLVQRGRLTPGTAS